MRLKKLGIALGGGAARGWAHIGVLKALDKIGIKPDVIAGTSIGSIVGGCYAAEELEQLEHFATQLTTRKVLGFMDLNLAGTSLITGKRICATLESHLKDVRIETMKCQYISVATELGTGHEVWMDKGYLVDAMRASYALPGIFKPVNINNRWLFDGAIVNPIPVSVCRAFGADIVIAVNLNNDSFGRGTVISSHEANEIDYKPGEAMSDLNGRSTLGTWRSRFFRVKSDSPGISKVMLEAFNITQDRIARARLAGDPPNFSIKPRLDGIGLFDFHRAEEMIALGEEATWRVKDEIEHHFGSLAA